MIEIKDWLLNLWNESLTELCSSAEFFLDSFKDFLAFAFNRTFSSINLKALESFFSYKSLISVLKQPKEIFPSIARCLAD